MADADPTTSQAALDVDMDRIEVVNESDEEAEDDDDGAINIPVYLSRASAYGSKDNLSLFQYPNYPAGGGVPMPPSAAERNLHLGARWRPHVNWVEVDVPLDTRPKVYNSEAGQTMGANVVPPQQSKKGKKVKNEVPSDDEDLLGAAPSASRPRGPKLDKIRLQSTLVPNATRYFIGVMHDGKCFCFCTCTDLAPKDSCTDVCLLALVGSGALHLSALDSVQQLRPSLHHLDLNDAAQKGTDEPAGGLMGAKGRSITVSVREQAADSRGASFSTPGAPSREQILAPLVEAEQEPWVDLRWHSDQSPTAHEALQNRLYAKDKASLACTALPADYF